jgi:hypothetical protein
MKKLPIYLAMSVLGAAGWYAGAKIGLGTALLLSSIGSCLGVYVGWRISRSIDG